MNTILQIIKQPTATVMMTMFSWFSVKYVPSGMIFMWLVLAVMVDLLTGILKAWAKKEATTSEGFRRTISKIGIYLAVIILVIIMVNIIGSITLFQLPIKDLSLLIDVLLAFMVFIELYSICENVYEINPESPLSRFLVKPLLKFFKGKLKDADKLLNPKTETDEQ